MSLYTNSDGRIVMQHYCALTARGNQVRLVSPVTSGAQDEFVFAFASAANLATPADAPMHRMVLRIKDTTHFSEVWTKRENGKDVVFSLDYTRR
ncbi:MAG: hypothetical protein ABSG56_08175 [Bryobacteraceae bacterium]